MARLIYIADNVSNFYSPFFVKKKDGSDRQIKAPKPELKSLQRRINSRIFSNCFFPAYLQGSVKDEDFPRDFVTNAKLHAKSKGFVCADIKSFYPSIKSGCVKKIFKYLFCFPDDVANILVSLTTLDGEVPQGAPTSSYISNLVFYDNEHKLVGELQRNKLIYTRLIDDITVSSEKVLDKPRQAWIVGKLRGFVSSKNLKLHPSKLKLETAKTPGRQVYVTGLWVDMGHPRLPSAVQEAIRKAVYECKERYAADYATSREYHKLHGATSGRVALMTRLGHKQAIRYRESLRLCLPEYDKKKSKKVTTLCYRFADKHGDGSDRVAYAKSYHRLMHCLSILGRTSPKKSGFLRAMLKKHPPKYKLKELVEE